MFLWILKKHMIGCQERNCGTVHEKVRRGREACELVQEMYEDSRISGDVCGWALSPFLFSVVMNRQTDKVRESLWLLMIAVICSESREQMEESLKRWRNALERRRMKETRQNLCQTNGKGNMQGTEIVKVDAVKYVESAINS